MDKIKNHIGLIVVSAAIVFSTFLAANAFKNRNSNNDTINVTGLGSKDFESDLIVWNSSFTKKSADLKTAYASLEKDRDALKNYLLSKGVKEKEIVFSSVGISKDFDKTYDEYQNVRSEVFTGLKLKMIAEATKDAKLRAEKIAENAGAKLGDLKKSEMGVFQIIAQNSSEDYSWGGSFNTSSKKKTANITMKLSYNIR